MNLLAIRLLLPCHSLDDFPTFHEGDDAENLLVTWSVPWHPAFLAQLQKLPEWGRVENIPESCQDQTFLVPKISVSRLPGGFRQRCSEEGGLLLEVPSDRQQALAALAQQVGLSAPLAAVSPSLAEDFFALAYTYLQIELLTRQLRYTSNLDTNHFQTQVVKAATAAVQGDLETAESALGRCFDLLSEERHRYYPMPSYLCDLTLLAGTTLQPPTLEQSLRDYPTTWVASTSLLNQIERQSPALWNSIVTAITNRQLIIASAGFSQAPTGLLSHETLHRNLKWSQEHAANSLSQPHRIFARRLPGLEFTLPGYLRQFGFQGALHESFQDARLPQASHTYLRWQGPDGETIPGLTKTIYDANSPNTFLKLGIRIGETLDIDHVSASQFVHWPGRTSTAYQDLLRSAARCDALGKWCLLDDLMSQLNDPGYSPNLSGFDYRAGYLRQQVALQQLQDPIQEFRSCIHHEHEFRQTSLWSGLAQMARGHQPPVSPEAWDRWTKLANPSQAATEQPAELSEQPTESSGQPTDTAPPNSEEDLIEQWRALLPNASHLKEIGSQFQAQFVQSITRGGTDQYLLLNNDSQVRRVLLEPAQWSGVDPSWLPADQVYAAHRDRQGWWAIVDVPAMGYIHLPTTRPTTKSATIRQPRTKIASGKLNLRNEFMTATIDPQTGALRSLHDYQSRSNLCSLQVAWFDQTLASSISKLLKSSSQLDWKQSLTQLLGSRGTDDQRKHLIPFTQGYSMMKAQRVDLLINNPLVAQIRSEGQLSVLNKSIAKFRLDYRLELGSRFLQVACQLQPTEKEKEIPLSEEVTYTFPPTNAEPAGSGFRRYFGWRFAQSHPSAEVFRDLNSARHEAARPTTEAPKLLEFQNVDQSIALLTDGLAFHRFPADGRSDTLIGLTPANSNGLTYEAKMAIGLSPKNGIQAAEQFLSSPAVVPCGPLRDGVPPTAWMYRCSSQQVLLTHWENRYHEGQWIGVRLRMLETMGRSRKFKLEFAAQPSTARAISSQWADDLLKKSLPVVKLDGDVIECSLSPYEQMELEVDFPGRP